MRNKEDILKKMQRVSEGWWFAAICVIILSIVGATYYFGIVKMVVPSSEDCMQIYHHWLGITSGNRTAFHEDIIGTISDTIAYSVLGCTYNAVRLNWTIKYGFLLFIVGIISTLFAKNKKTNILLCPIFILFLIEQHLFEENSRYAWSYSSDVDMLTFYPSNYHLGPIIAGFICIALVYLIKEELNNKNKIILSVITIIISIYYFLYGDLIFYVVFLIPYTIYLIICWWHNDRSRYRLLYGTILLGIGLISTKFAIGTKLHDFLWTSNSSSRRVYGEVSWTIFENLSQWIDNATYMVLCMFNIDRAYSTVISVWSLLLIIRLILLLMVFYLVIVVVVTGLKDINRFDVIDYICSYSIVIFIFAKIFTQFCWGLDRYFFSIVPLSVILLIRNFDIVVFCITRVNIHDDAKLRYLLCVVGCIIAILGVNNVWSRETKDTDRDNIENVITYMEKNGEGYAIAKYTLYARMGVQAQGRELFFENQEMHDKYFKEEKPRYIIANWDEGVCQAYRWPNSEEEFIEEYGTPVDTQKYGNIWLHRMW